MEEFYQILRLHVCIYLKPCKSSYLVQHNQQERWLQINKNKAAVVKKSFPLMLIHMALSDLCFCSDYLGFTCLI